MTDRIGIVQVECVQHIQAPELEDSAAVQAWMATIEQRFQAAFEQACLSLKLGNKVKVKVRCYVM